MYQLQTGPKRPFKFELKTPTKKSPWKQYEDSPKVTLDISDAEVQRRTGFKTKNHLLMYIIVVCNGDFDKIVEGGTVLTWFEKWFAHFEFKWGRMCARQVDFEVTYGPHRKNMQLMIEQKYAMEIEA